MNADVTFAWGVCITVGFIFVVILLKKLGFFWSIRRPFESKFPKFIAKFYPEDFFYAYMLDLQHKQGRGVVAAINQIAGTFTFDGGTYYCGAQLFTHAGTQKEDLGRTGDGWYCGWKVAIGKDGKWTANRNHLGEKDVLSANDAPMLFAIIDEKLKAEPQIWEFEEGKKNKKRPWVYYIKGCALPLSFRSVIPQVYIDIQAIELTRAVEAPVVNRMFAWMQNVNWAFIATLVCIVSLIAMLYIAWQVSLGVETQKQTVLAIQTMAGDMTKMLNPAGT
jgi:hypothetical protein